MQQAIATKSKVSQGWGIVDRVPKIFHKVIFKVLVVSVQCFLKDAQSKTVYE